MSTKHGLDREGAVVCGTSPRADGSNVASNPDLVTCVDCNAEKRWFINEAGDVYDYYLTRQAADFPNDFHIAYETQDEAEIAAGHLPEDPGTVEQVSYDEAISYAIFAINTFMHPDASSDADIARLELHSDEIIATLVDLRDTVRGLADQPKPEPRWPAVTPT